MNHYVYEIVNIISGKRYIGVRSCSCDPEDDLGKKYFSSSSTIQYVSHQKENPSEYKYIILSLHESRKSANDEEIRLHNLYSVDTNPIYVNKSRSTSSGFVTFGHTVIKDCDGKTRLIDLKTFKDENLTHINKGKVVVKNLISNNYESISVECFDKNIYMHVSNGKINVIDKSGLHIKIDVAEYDRNSHIIFSKNKVVVKDNDGNIFQCSIYDDRYLRGELVPINKERVPVIDENGNRFSVSIYDEKYISGEYTLLSKGYVRVVEDGKIITIKKDDPRYVNGELNYFLCGKSVVKDKDGNKMLISVDDERILSGELVSFMKGMIHTKDLFGNKFFIERTDHRFIEGSLITCRDTWVATNDGYFSIKQLMKKHNCSKYKIKRMIAENGWMRLMCL